MAGQKTLQKNIKVYIICILLIISIFFYYYTLTNSVHIEIPLCLDHWMMAVKMVPLFRLPWLASKRDNKWKDSAIDS